MRKFRGIFLLLLSLFMAFGLTNITKDGKSIDVLATPNEERELKAVWVSPFIADVSVNGEYAFKTNMGNVLSKMESFGYNALIFHVRTHNNALYPSNINPKASYVSSINFNIFDPLEWLVEESHKRGIELHAWLNPYRAGSTYHSGTIPASNPYNNSSNVVKTTGAIEMLDPAKTVVKEHIADTVNEIITNYDVDAIHFDDYFYMNMEASYSTPESQRMGHVNDMIEMVSNTIKTHNTNNNKHVQLGISPTGIYKNGNGNVFEVDGMVVSSGSAGTRGQQHGGHYLYADTLHWMNQRWIDYIMPQIYWSRTLAAAPFETVFDWWSEVTSYLDTNFYVGLGLHFAANGDWTNTDELNAQMSIIENDSEAKGFSIFSYRHFNSTTGATKTQLDNAYNYRPDRKQFSVLPELKSMTPVIPNKVTVNRYGSSLSWNSVSNAKFYYIYGSNGTLTYSNDEIIGVTNLTNFELGSNSYSNYAVRVLSPTNHLSEPATDVPVGSEYDISYNLNGGSFAGYATRDEMLKDFFTDVHSFLNISMSYNNFVHGSGKTSGYGGVYDQETYFNELYNINDKSVNASTNKFINQPEYNKWVPLFDLIDNYVRAINSGQGFWKSRFEGRARFKDFMQQNNYGKPETGPILNQIPTELTGTSIVYKYNSSSNDIILPIPVKTGDTFGGWYTNANFTGSSVTKIPKGSQGDKTFYAKWEKSVPVIEYVDVKFNLGYNNLTLPTVKVEKGKKVTKPANPSRSGYTFLGWYSGGVLYNFNNAVNSNLTLTAYWELQDEPPQTVKVNFNLGYNNLTLPTKEVEIGTKVTKPADPSRNGYTFDGWYLGNAKYDFNDDVNYNITLTARWKEVSEPVDNVTITLNYNYNNKTETVKVERGTKLSKPTNPTRSGYDFLGWYLGNDQYDFNRDVEYNFTLTARWKEKSTSADLVNVTFDHGYDNKKDIIEIERGTSATKPKDPTRNGFTFLGWYFIDELYNFNNSVDYSITLVAKWKEKEVEDLVTITFDLNYSNNSFSEEIIRGNKINKPENPTRSGYKFLGWYFIDELYDFNSPVSYNITLIARWSKEVTDVKVTFDYGSSKEVKKITINSKVNEPPLTPSKEGQIFKGWYLGANKYDFTKTVNKDITLIATFYDSAKVSNVAAYGGTTISLDKKGLIYYAKLNSSYLTKDHGFYLVYGKTTKTDLLNSLKTNNKVNNKVVFKVEVKGIKQNGTYSVLLTGIPTKGYNDVISVIPYIEDGNDLILADSFQTSTFNNALNNGKTVYFIVEEPFKRKKRK